ncbi:MAG: cytochrome c biogenesis CcdA family protein [Thermaerobacter sp.]|nr:cytochrome c biogenesis CcdA family protein [Thermaerobacter sp.]
MRGTVSLPIAFVGGILSFLSPCVLPLLPSYLALLSAGSSLSSGRRMLHALGFVLGFALVFILLGLSATVIGHLLLRERTVLRYAGGIIVILLGLFMLGLQPSVLLRDARFHYSPEHLGFGSSMLVGASFGFGWTACVTPYLGTILVLASQTAHWQEGAILLAAYALGLGVPFLLLGLLADRIVSRLRGLQRYGRLMEQVGGALLIVLGILMISGVLARLSGFGSFF